MSVDIFSEYPVFSTEYLSGSRFSALNTPPGSQFSVPNILLGSHFSVQCLYQEKLSLSHVRITRPTTRALGYNFLTRNIGSFTCENYKTYYRSVRVQLANKFLTILNCFELYLTLFLVFLDLYWLVYLSLSLIFPCYIRLYRIILAISGYLSYLSYLRLSWVFSGNLGLSLGTAVHLKLS